VIADIVENHQKQRKKVTQDILDEFFEIRELKWGKKN